MTITIKDIAAASGVSYSTVSKALNDSPLVKQATKTKVIQIAKDLGYEPNFAAQRLVKKESKLIGLAWPTLDRMAHSVLATKINEEFTKNGYSMILSINSIQTSLDIFKRYQADGIIIFDEQSTKTVHALSSTIPIVSYGVGKDKDFPIVDVNYQKAMYTAVEYLYKLDHIKIAFIGDFSPIDDRQIEKYHGFKNAMHHFKLSFSDDNLINTAGLSWFDGYTATKRLLQSDFIPTAIIGASYDISAGIVRAIREENFIIPKDISVISYDNIPQMGNMEIPLTSVGVPVNVMAQKIVQTILHAIQNRQDVPLIQILDPQLTERNSCAHARNM